MMNTDPVADMLTRIRNSVRAKQTKCVIPASRLIEDMLKILKEAGYIKSYVREEDKVQDQLVVVNKYLGKNLEPVLHYLKKISKPGRRIYRRYRDVKPLLNGIGISILSTPKGVMTDADARKNHVGGEVLCEVW
ncbi:MAG: 30S ribosomal protein S8 [Deltaproteobacteria bacterium]|nr:30S ribosomal protein S8 [Deltaproteobacteria bacterium]